MKPIERITRYLGDVGAMVSISKSDLTLLPKCTKKPKKYIINVELSFEFDSLISAAKFFRQFKKLIRTNDATP